MHSFSPLLPPPFLAQAHTHENFPVTRLTRTRPPSRARSTTAGRPPSTNGSGNIGILNVNFRGALAGNSNDDRAYFEALTQEWDLEWRRC
ncbi:hypothetical protein VTK26DRAFT_3850 [Humicola hyalothermophila]